MPLQANQSGYNEHMTQQTDDMTKNAQLKRQALVQATAEALRPNARIFFIGIGGISMCGLAELAHAEGMVCAGSDARPNERCTYLESLGIEVHTGHDAANIDHFRPDLVVMTRAIFADNPERLRAAELGLTLVERAVFLGALSLGYPQVVNIAGTNGKSTTTALASLILMESGADPTVHLGAELIEFKTTVHVGGRERFVSEACEFGRGFYHYRSNTAIILNIVHDHIDCYETLDDMIDAFVIFAANTLPGGTLCLPSGDLAVEEMWRRFQTEYESLSRSINLFIYGKAGTDFCGMTPQLAYANLRYENGLPRFSVTLNGEPYEEFALSVPGEFNVENAMGALAVAHLNGGERKAAKKVLAAFRGAEGRFTYTGTYNGAKIYADYAHHPSAVKVTVQAARNIPAKTLHICFQPLTHSRVRGFFAEFVDALKDVRPLYMSEIYDDRERDTTISSQDICDEINRSGGEAYFFKTNEALREHVRPLLQPGDVFLVMGVDLRQIADDLTTRKSHLDAVTQ